MDLALTHDARPEAAETVLTASRVLTADDHRSWTVVKRADATFQLTSSASIDGQHWTVDEVYGPFTTWKEAASSDPVLTLLRAGQSAHFDLVGDALELAAMLRCEPSEEPALVDWPDGEVGYIGKHHIFFLPRPDNGALVAILVDDDEVQGEELAHYYWSDDYTPMSSPFSSSLTEFSPGMAVLFPTGEGPNGDGAFIIVLTEDPEQRAVGVAEWLEHMGIHAQAAAVLEIDPLDPGNQLSEQQRAEWESALSLPDCTLNFWLDDETDAAVRTLISEERVRDALANPLSEDGAILYNMLTEDDILEAIYNGRLWE